MIPGVTTHARQRMQERFGCIPTADEWRRVVLDIIDGRARLLGSQSHKELYRVHIWHHVVSAWWDPTKACIVTVLPHNAAPTQGFRPCEYSEIRRHSAQISRSHE